MAVTITVPTMGLAIEEVTLANWLKHEGDAVQKGEPIADLITDKVNFELVAPENGILLKLLCAAETVVPIGQIVAVIGQPGEDIGRLLAQTASGSEAPPAPKTAAARPALPLPAPPKVAAASMPTPTIVATVPADISPTVPGSATRAPSGPTRQIPPPVAAPTAFPAARHLARELGIELARVTGSGPGGAIRREDVEAFARAQTAAAADNGAPTHLEEEVIPLVGVRRSIAEHMLRSQQTAAHVTTVVEVDMTQADGLRRQSADLPGQRRVSHLALVIKAALAGVADFPAINSSLQQDRIIIKKYVHMGIAVAGKKGLLVPVLHDAHRKDFWQIAREVEELTERARAGELTAAMVQGGTLTISNAGAFGAVLATPIIHQPQSAILWMGRIAKKPAVYQDQIAIRSLMFLALSYDHRVLDGAEGAQFLQVVKANLERPLGLVMS